MRILVDVDGVVAEFIIDLFKIVKPKVRLSTIKEWDAFTYLTDDEYDTVKKVLRDPSFCRNISVREKSQDAIEYLKQQGHEIVWVTAPYEDCKQWEHERRSWIHRHFGKTHTDIVFCEAKYVVQGDVFIDDKPSNILKWHQHNPKDHAYLYDCGYNQNVQWNLRLTWDDIRNIDLFKSKGP